MLLTGFDAPVEQVLYLDAPLREHTLLQAIARVNRTAEGKTYGLVVDYWGDNRRITDALELFSEEDGVLNALRPISEKIQLLESRHRAAMRLFEGVNRANEEAVSCPAGAGRRARQIRTGFPALRRSDGHDPARPQRPWKSPTRPT